MNNIMYDVGVDILSDMWIVVMDTLKFFGKVADAVDVLAAIIVDVVSTSGVDTLTDDNENGLATATSAFESTMPAP